MYVTTHCVLEAKQTRIGKRLSLIAHMFGDFWVYQHRSGVVAQQLADVRRLEFDL